MAFDKFCIDAVFTDPDVNTSKAWETLAGLQRNEAVAYSTGGVPWLAGQVLQVTDLIQNPDRARGKYKRVDLLAARPAQPGDTGPYVLALQDSPVDDYEVSVLLVGHIRADFSGAGVGETWNPGDLLYVDTNGALTNNPIKLDANGAAVIQVVSATGGLFFGSGTNAALIDSKMRWRGNWVNGETYRKNDVVLDAPWLMIANTETQDRPGVINSGDEFYDLSDVPTFTAPQHSGVVWSGVQYTIGSQPVKAVGYQMWVPELTVDTNYTLRLYTYPVGFPENAVYRQLAEPVLLENEWVTVAADQTIIAPNTVIGIVIDALNSGSDTTVTGGWTRAVNSNIFGDNPGTGAWGTANNEGSLRISYTDADSTDRTTELQGITAGATIVFVDTLDPSRSMTWQIGAAGTDQGTHIAFTNVVYDGAGPGGEPVVGDITTMNATVPVPAPTKYVQLTGQTNAPLPTDVTAEGILRYDGTDQPGGDANAYGVRVLWQEISASPDYDLMSTWEGIGGGGGGAGGAATFLELTDTPTGYGAVGQVPAVNATQDGLIWSNGGGGGGASTTLELTDTPNGYGTAGQYLMMNNALDALIWGNAIDLTGYLPKSAGPAQSLTDTLHITASALSAGVKMIATDAPADQQKWLMAGHSTGELAFMPLADDDTGATTIAFGQGGSIGATSDGVSYEFRFETSDDTGTYKNGFTFGNYQAVPNAQVAISTTGQAGLEIVDSSTSNASPWLRMLAKRGDANTWTSFASRQFLYANRTDGAVPAGKHLGGMMFGGNHTDGDPANLASAASIWGVAEAGFVSASDMPTALSFRTGTSGQTETEVGVNVTFGTERIRITSSGNVGIGTSTPNAVLHVNGSVIFDQGGTRAAIVEPAGPDVTSPQGIMTLEKADTRYVQMDEATFVGLLEKVEDLEKRMIMLEMAK